MWVKGECKWSSVTITVPSVDRLCTVFAAIDDTIENDNLNPKSKDERTESIR